MSVQSILFVTSNINKFAEAKRILSKFNINLIHYNFSYNEIRSEYLEEIAKDAAKKLFKVIRKELIVEDSGLFIDSLNGFPGTYSAWVFKKIGNEGILKLMKNLKNREASFKSCIAFASDKCIKTFIGEVRGKISLKIRGNQGFGFDPIFIPKNYKKTFAENENLKNKISHRTNALLKFANWYLSR